MNIRKCIHWCGALSLLLPASAQAQSVLTVPSSFPTIQAAINAASNGDTVLVSAGTYQEFIDFQGKAIVVRSLSGALSTKIDGVNPFAPNSKSLVTFSHGEGSNSVLNGFTLTRGGGNLLSNWYLGGAIFCDNSSPTIQNNIIVNNYASFGGGIACIHNASPLIDNNKIGDLLGGGNQAIDGGGIYCQFTSNPAITNNSILGNNAGAYCQSGTPANPGGFGSHEGVAFHSGIYVPGDAGFPGGGGSGGTLGGGGGGGGGYWGGWGQTCIGGHGGGIFCANQSTPLISKNLIEENTAGSYQTGGMGGGIYCEGQSNAFILDNDMKTNSSISGGAIAIVSSAPQIAENKIYENSAFYQGAGIVCTEGSSATISDNVIRENSSNHATGISIQGSGAMIISNKISKNIATNNAAGIQVCNTKTCNESCSGPFCDVTADAVILANNMIWENVAGGDDGGGIHFAGLGSIINNTICKNVASGYGGGLIINGGTPTVANNIFWGNTPNQVYPAQASISYCIVQGGFAGWNFNENPSFVDYAGNDYHLVKQSPAIDAANLGVLGLPATDFEGDPRIIGAGLDIGADEYRPILQAFRYQFQ